MTNATPRRRFRRRTLIAAGLVLAWTAVLLGGAVPAWRRALRLQREVETVERDLADLDRWSVAGLWLEPAVQRREPAVARVWSGLFPARRGREQLFLDLARIADRSGVAAFSLAEITALGLPVDEMAGPTGPADAPPPPPDGTAAAVAPPAVTLDSYRVRARFEADFVRAADFLAGLRGIERALDVTNLVIRPSGGRLNVEMEMDVYVDRHDES